MRRRGVSWMYPGILVLLSALPASADWIDVLIDTGNRLAGIAADAPSRTLQRRAVEYVVFGGEQRFDAMVEATTGLLEAHAPDGQALNARLTNAVGRGLAEQYQSSDALDPRSKASFETQLKEAEQAFTTTASLSRAVKGRTVNWFLSAGPRAYDALIRVARRGQERSCAIGLLGTMARSDGGAVRDALREIAQRDPDKSVRDRATLALQAMDLPDPAATLIDHPAEFHSTAIRKGDEWGDLPGELLGILPVGTPVIVLREEENCGPATWWYHRVRVIATGREGLICPAYLLDDRYIWKGY